MESAVAVRGRVTIWRDIGFGTNMDAEWLALIAALRTAHALNVADFVLIGDAMAVINQANGVVRCSAPCRAHLDVFNALVRGGDRPRIRHVRRAHNLAGIALARLHER